MASKFSGPNAKMTPCQYNEVLGVVHTWFHLAALLLEERGIPFRQLFAHLRYNLPKNCTTALSIVFLVKIFVNFVNYVYLDQGFFSLLSVEVQGTLIEIFSYHKNEVC